MKAHLRIFVKILLTGLNKFIKKIVTTGLNVQLLSSIASSGFFGPGKAGIFV